MSSVVIAGDTSGSVTLQAPADAGSTVLTLPAQTGTVMVNGPAFSAYQSGSAQVISPAGTYNKIRIDTEELDTNSNYDNTTNYRFTPTVAGYYQVNGCISLAGGANLVIAIYKNGSVFKYGSGSTSSNITSDNVAALISMNGSTDYIELWGYSNVTATLVATASGTYFQAFLARSA